MARAQRLRRVVLHRGRCRPARTAELREHRAFLSVGHDEYWSGQQRLNVEAARGAGLNLAFLSGNEVFWKTRWENGYRTLVCYKATHGTPRRSQRHLDRHISRWSGVEPRGGEPRELADRNQLRGERRHERDRGPGERWRPAALAQHERREPEWRSDRDAPRRDAGLRVGRGHGERLPAARAGPPFHHRARRRRGSHRRRQPVRVRAGDTPPHPLPPRQRRARLRRRHGPVVVGARQPARSRRQCHEHRHAAGDGEPLRGHERPARCAAVRSVSRGRVCGRDTTDGSGVGPAALRQSCDRQRYRDGCGRRPGRRRGGFGGQRRHLAPGRGPRELELHLDAVQPQRSAERAHARRG